MRRLVASPSRVFVARLFQYSIGDALTGKPYDPKAEYPTDVFQYSIGDAGDGGKGYGWWSEAHAAFNTPLEMQRWPSYPAHSLRVLSILHWRCHAHIIQTLPRPKALSILHWRCLRTLIRYVWLDAGVLSILHWRCAEKNCRKKTRQKPGNFQYSIGDAVASALFAAILVRWRLSILHWRCWGFLSLVFVGF